MNSPAKRTLAQVQNFLVKCAKNGSDMSAANLLANHGNLEDDARAFVLKYVGRA